MTNDSVTAYKPLADEPVQSSVPLISVPTLKYDKSAEESTLPLPMAEEAPPSMKMERQEMQERGFGSNPRPIEAVWFPFTDEECAECRGTVCHKGANFRATLPSCI